MSAFEHLQKLQATTMAIASFDTPITKFIKQQHALQERFRVLSDNHSSIFKQAAMIAKSPAFSALAGLESLRDISKSVTGLHHQTSSLIAIRHLAKSIDFQQKTLTASLKEMHSMSLLGMNNPALKGTRLFNEITQLGILPKIAAIPSSTMLDIKSIIGHQEKFNLLTSSVAKGIFATDLSTFRAQGIYPDTFQSQLKTLSLALKRQGEQFTASAILEKNWNAIEDFEKAQSETLKVGEVISIDNNLLEAELLRLQDLLESLKNFFLRYKGHLSGTKTALEVLTLFIGFYTFFADPKVEGVRQEDIIALRSDLDSLKQLLKTEAVYVTNHTCRVYLKPKSRSFKVSKLACGEEVTLIETHRKWAYISFQSGGDNFSQTGWVLKKYLHIKK